MSSVLTQEFHSTEWVVRRRILKKDMTLYRFYLLPGMVLRCITLRTVEKTGTKYVKSK